VVLDAKTDAPVPDVALTIHTAEGNENPATTNDSGVAEVQGLHPEPVSVTSGSDDATGPNILAFVTLNSPATSMTELAPDILIRPVPASSGGQRQIRVLGSAATSNAPKFVDTKDDPSASGAAAVGTQTDPFSKEGLDIDTEHTIRVAPLQPFIFFLREDRGFAIPEAAYHATLSDLSEVQGTLDRRGIGVIWNAPDGPFEIRYDDLDDVQVKSLAGRVRKACAEKDVNEIYKVLLYSPDLIAMAVTAYSSYFDDLSGKGMGEDIQDAAADAKQLRYFQMLMDRAGLPTRDDIKLRKITSPEDSTDA